MKDSYIGSKDHPATNEQTEVECWEQQASASEVKDYEKRGIRISRKIFFLADPGVTERHEILITHRMVNGELTAVANPVSLDVKSRTDPDASAGLGVVYKVMADVSTGATQ